MRRVLAAERQMCRGSLVRECWCIGRCRLGGKSADDTTVESDLRSKIGKVQETGRQELGLVAQCLAAAGARCVPAVHLQTGGESCKPFLELQLHRLGQREDYLRPLCACPSNVVHCRECVEGLEDLREDLRKDDHLGK
jgi:hypothetical protein